MCDSPWPIIEIATTKNLSRSPFHHIYKVAGSGSNANSAPAPPVFEPRPLTEPARSSSTASPAGTNRPFRLLHAAASMLAQRPPASTSNPHQSCHLLSLLFFLLFVVCFIYDAYMYVCMHVYIYYYIVVIIFCEDDNILIIIFFGMSQANAAPTPPATSSRPASSTVVPPFGRHVIMQVAPMNFGVTPLAVLPVQLRRALQRASAAAQSRAESASISTSSSSTSSSQSTQPN